jgi:4-diphosphocytidyl-2-C-methyl-D-erythritol kinase
MRLLAPAKINVYLRIVGQRPDGYHLLDSLIVPVSLYDEIHLAVAPMAHDDRRDTARIVVTCDPPTVPGDETNLAYKATALLCQEAGIQAHITITLRKRIPVGAGLGGGSSDAAAVLKGLNALLGLGCTDAQLGVLAACLGADVPFFIPCCPAQVQGIGEILTPVPALPARWLVLVVPPFGVSTPWAYQRFDALPQPEYAVAAVAPSAAAGQWPGPGGWVNDLEPAVIPAHPRIGTIKQRLLHLGAEGALMSGSGAAVFGVFATPAAARQAQEALAHCGTTFVVEPLAGPAPCLSSDSALA